MEQPGLFLSWKFCEVEMERCLRISLLSRTQILIAFFYVLSICCYCLLLFDVVAFISPRSDLEMTLFPVVFVENKLFV